MKVGLGHVYLRGKAQCAQISECELSACVWTCWKVYWEDSFHFLMQMKCQASFLEMAMSKTQAGPQAPTTFSLASASKVIDSIIPLEILFPAFLGEEIKGTSKRFSFQSLSFHSDLYNPRPWRWPTAHTSRFPKPSGALTRKVWTQIMSWPLNPKSSNITRLVDAWSSPCLIWLCAIVGSVRWGWKWLNPRCERPMTHPAASWTAVCPTLKQALTQIFWRLSLGGRIASGKSCLRLLNGHLCLLHESLLKYAQINHASWQACSLWEKSIPALEFSFLIILRKLLRKSKHCFEVLFKAHTVQTVSINPECKRHFSKLYCSPNDNNAILTDFPGSSGSLEKNSQASKILTKK